MRILFQKKNFLNKNKTQRFFGFHFSPYQLSTSFSNFLFALLNGFKNQTELNLMRLS